MQINLKLGGPLVKYSPSDPPKNNPVIEVDTNSTVQSVLQHLKVPDGQAVMVILNNSMVTRPDYASTLLSQNDELSLLKPITAG